MPPNQRRSKPPMGAPGAISGRSQPPAAASISWSTVAARSSRAPASTPPSRLRGHPPNSPSRQSSSVTMRGD